jgi:hypothetical protein
MRNEEDPRLAILLSGSRGAQCHFARGAPKNYLSAAAREAVKPRDVEKLYLMIDERKYVLAIVRPENLRKLEDAGLDHYAVKRGAKLRPGDRIVLYRSRGGAPKGKSGIVGIFEVTAAPLETRPLNQEVFSALYPIQIPWRTMIASLERPMPIAPLVSKLSIFTNKSRYGSVLQISMKSLPEADYVAIEHALRKHVAEP